MSSESKCNITFTSGLSESDYNKYIEAGKALHRNTYRGKDITEYYNDGSLYTRISNGSFEDIYVGDYIVANGVIWLVADIDNYLYSGDTPLTKHHATIIPATPLVIATMTMSYGSGYAGSKVVNETFLNLISSDGVVGRVFANHILEYRNALTNSINQNATNPSVNVNGVTNGTGWYTRSIDLMSEMNVYGGTVWSSAAYDTGIDNRQYAIFNLKPEFINSYGDTRYTYWLKDVTAYPNFAIVHETGSCGCDSAANNSYGVRPRFLIG